MTKKNIVTKEHLDRLVAKSQVEYDVFGTLTIAVITLPTNFKVVGKSACADVNNFDKDLGEKYALDDAVKKLWELEGYLLANKIHEQNKDSKETPTDDLMDFGTAVNLLKKGEKIARIGWNGKDMFVYYVPAASYPAQRNSKGTMQGIFPNDMVPYNHYMALKGADNTVSTWVPSVTDVLAEDWILVK